MPNDFVMRAVQERSLVLLESHCVRTFLHLDDAIDAYVMAASRADEMKGEIYNVGCNDMNFSKLQIAEEIKKIVDFEIIDSTVPDFDVRNFVINFDKLAALDYKPKRTLQEGLEELVKLFKFYKPARRYNVI